jgi:sterol-4alpha-carboxylate 3-dehydrogenase (decarboxylating)
MNFLVIGGNGFLGKAIVELLLERKYIVSVFDISKSHDDHRLSAFHVGDITNPAHVSNACKGVDIVIHTASPIHGKPAPVYFKVNVDGTANIIASCVEHGVSKLIFTSSAGVIYNGQDLCNADETTPYCEIHMDAYNESKVFSS